MQDSRDTNALSMYLQSARGNPGLFFGIPLLNYRLPQVSKLKTVTATIQPQSAFYTARSQTGNQETLHYHEKDKSRNCNHHARCHDHSPVEKRRIH